MTDRNLQVLFESFVEHPSKVNGVIKGTLPDWLQGSLIRNGPAKWDLAGDFCLNHFFDGCAMLTRFEFHSDSDGCKKVSAQTKFLRSDAYEKMHSVGRPVYTEFGTKAFPDTTKSVWSRLVNKVVPSDLTDNDFANIYQVHGEVYVSTESCNIWKLDPHDLKALLKVNLDKHPGISICSAHPLYSAEEQISYNVGSTFLTGMKYHVMKTVEKGTLAKPTDGETTVLKNSSTLCSLSSSYKGSLAYSHSFCMSTNHLVLIEQPYLVNGLKLMTCTPKGKSMQECIEWCPDEPTRFHVIRKSDGALHPIKFVSSAIFFLHTINAFEDQDHLIVDLIAYDDPSLFEHLKMEPLRQGKYDSKTPPKPMRFILPLKDLKSAEKGVNLITLPNTSCTATLESNGNVRVTGKMLGPAGMENPMINSSKIGKPYRYVYGSGLFDTGFFGNSVGKLDLNDSQVLMYKKAETEYPGEAVFVPRPNAVEEDDGVVITQVLVTDVSKPNYLAILDAKSMEELATIEFDRESIRLPPSVHGLWQWPLGISNEIQKAEQ